MNGKLGACELCAEPGKYKCPGCKTVTCSLKCSRAHKAAKSCDGQAAPVWKEPLQANEWTWGSMMRDESFLANVGRQVADVGRDIVSQKLLPDDKHPRERLDERTQSEWRLVNGAKQENVRLILLPKGMSKRQANKSFWSQKEKLVNWSVEVTVHGALQHKDQQKTAFMSHNHPATEQISAGLTTAFGHMNKKRLNKLTDAEKALQTWLQQDMPLTADAAAQPFLVLLVSPVVPTDRDDDPSNKPQRVLLHPSETLRQALEGRAVVECPKLEIWPREAALHGRLHGRLWYEVRQTREHKRQIEEDQDFWKRPRIETADPAEAEQQTSSESSESEPDSGSASEETGSDSGDSNDEDDDEQQLIDDLDMQIAAAAAAPEAPHQSIDVMNAATGPSTPAA